MIFVQVIDYDSYVREGVYFVGPLTHDETWRKNYFSLMGIRMLGPYSPLEMCERFRTFISRIDSQVEGLSVCWTASSAFEIAKRVGDTFDKAILWELLQLRRANEWAAYEYGSDSMPKQPQDGPVYLPQQWLHNQSVLGAPNQHSFVQLRDNLVAELVLRRSTLPDAPPDMTEAFLEGYARFNASGSNIGRMFICAEDSLSRLMTELATPEYQVLIEQELLNFQSKCDAEFASKEGSYV